MVSVQLAIAGFFGLTGAMAGAFGAHGLKDKVSPERIAAFATASTYQLLHSTAMIGVCALQAFFTQQQGAKSAVVGHLRRAFWSYAIGVVLFSGSIYWLVLGGPKVLGPVTPVGGVVMMVGWASLMLSALCI